MPDPRDNNEDKSLGENFAAIVDHTTQIVHDEIELAKAEIASSLQNLLRGSVAAIVGGVFAFFGLFILLIGLSFLISDAIGKFSPWIGFFVVAILAFLIGGLLAWFALRNIKKGSQLAPTQAIDEARQTKAALAPEEVQEIDSTAVEEKPVAEFGAPPKKAEGAEPSPIPSKEAKADPEAAAAIDEMKQARAESEQKAKEAKEARELAEKEKAEAREASQAATKATQEAAKADAVADRKAEKAEKKAAKAREKAEKEAEKQRIAAEKQAAKEAAAAEKQAAKDRAVAEKKAKQDAAAAEKEAAKAAKQAEKDAKKAKQPEPQEPQRYVAPPTTGAQPTSTPPPQAPPQPPVQPPAPPTTPPPADPENPRDPKKGA